jgi:hypothetical protein
MAAAVGHSTTTAAFGSLGFAALAPLWFVLESFIGEEHLFPGRKYKLSATLRTLQDLIVEFHEPLPLAQVGQGSWASCL